jgi:hypothetical protein
VKPLQDCDETDELGDGTDAAGRERLGANLGGTVEVAGMVTAHCRRLLRERDAKQVLHRESWRDTGRRSNASRQDCGRARCGRPPISGCWYLTGAQLFV